MSDEQMPAWALVLEEKLAHRVIAANKDLEVVLTAKIEEAEHAILRDVGKAINDSEARTAARIADLRDDLAVTMARAELAHDKINGDRAELQVVRKEVVLLYERLRRIEDRLFNEGRKPPEDPGKS